MSDLIINTLGVCRSEVNLRCQPLSPFFLESGYLTFPWDSLIQLDCLARQPQGSTHLHLLVHGLWEYNHMLAFIPHMASGDYALDFVLTLQMFYQLNHLLRPQIIFFFSKLSPANYVASGQGSAASSNLQSSDLRPQELGTCTPHTTPTNHCP